MSKLSTDKQLRKDSPIARGLLDYFPRACAAVAYVSRAANEQHNPGEEMHWAKEKSADHADCIVRHLIDRGSTDDDGLSHTAKVAWRALALLETELEGQAKLEGQTDAAVYNTCCHLSAPVQYDLKTGKFHCAICGKDVSK